MIVTRKQVAIYLLTWCLLAFSAVTHAQLREIKRQFIAPPDEYKPGVYWYFMDGNMTAESIGKDLESMKASGIGSVVFLEVNVGVPRGNVDFLSDRWFELFTYAVKEAERLNISVTLGIGPGWTGSGGPWVTGAQSMQSLVASETVISAGERNITLALPPPPPPFFGEGGIPDDLKKVRTAYYQDVAVLAFPQVDKEQLLINYKEKALFYRAPYSSSEVKPYLETELKKEKTYPAVPANQVLDLTNKMDKSGKLNWHPQTGKWVVMRFVSRNNGAVTRPAPVPGLGFEASKMDTVALKKHLDAYIGQIFKHMGIPKAGAKGGLKALHIDSWEMSSQNWTQQLRREFIKRRGYDPLKYLPVYYGHVVDNPEKSERFLWDLREVTQQLIFDYHAGYVKKYAHAHNLKLSIEPYDMNPTSDLELGSIADVPMGEFWSKGFGFNSSFSVVEATSIGHIEGKSLIQSEAFTAQFEGWRQYPGSMKNQGDWALAAGLNKFFFHTFENQFLPDSLKPGATMGPYGVHWDRSQTWWPMVSGYHNYLTRCQYLLRQGKPVADILYLTQEGCPNVFVAPPSAMTGDTIGDRRGYNFDACTGKQLMRATVKAHQIVFPSGAAYKILVLPASSTMTPELLGKIESLVKAGAVVAGPAPTTSPGLVNYPACDATVNKLGKQLWGTSINAKQLSYHTYGKGTIINGGAVNQLDGKLYPHYNTVATILNQLKYTEDFSEGSSIRYGHRTTANWDIYFVSNTTDKPVKVDAKFRSTKGSPQFWDAMNGESMPVPYFVKNTASTTIPLQLAPYESRFVVFTDEDTHQSAQANIGLKTDTLIYLNTNWDVAFNPKMGGPAHTTFDKLTDWSKMQEDGIKHYSGITVYTKSFDFIDNNQPKQSDRFYLDLGNVKNMARIKLNGKDLGIVWTAPWRVDISPALQKGHNVLQIEVANLWVNRLIGDERFPYDGPEHDQWPAWLREGKPRQSQRFTFTTARDYKANSPLQASGLLGPVAIIKQNVSR